MKPPISRFTVNGHSMLPTLTDGQDVLSFNWFVNPKVGDVVVIKYGGREMVKRVEKIDGEKVFVVAEAITAVVGIGEEEEEGRAEVVVMCVW